MPKVVRLRSVGSPQDLVRATAVALADIIILVTLFVSRFTIPALDEYHDFAAVVVVLSISLILAMYSGEWLANVWRVAVWFFSICKSALKGEGMGNNRRLELQMTGSNVTVSFYVLIASVVSLLAGLVYLVQTTGGVERSPFLQFVLAYSLSGVLIAGKTPTKLALLLLSVVTPLALLIPGTSEFAGQYSRQSIAALAATATVIAGFINFFTSKTDVKVVEGSGTQPDGRPVDPTV